MTKVVISFPKSGRTWLRFGLHIAGFPNLHFTHDGFEYNDGAKPNLNFDLQQRIAAYGGCERIVYVERNPHDTIVSLFHQVTGRFDDFFSYKGDLSNFIRDPYFGVHNLVRFQRMWRILASKLPVLTLTYEEMSADYSYSFKRVAKHFDLQIDDRLILRVAEKASFSSMKEIEKSLSFDEPWLRPRMGAMKVRRGKVGGYKDELSPKDIEYIDQIIDHYSY